MDIIVIDEVKSLLESSCKMKEVISNRLNVPHYLTILRKNEFTNLSRELDLVISNAQKCWEFLYNLLLTRGNQRLKAPHICISRNPIIVHFTWKSADYELYLEIKSNEEIYVCCNYAYDWLTNWKLYLQLDNFLLPEKLESALYIFADKS